MDVAGDGLGRPSARRRRGTPVFRDRDPRRPRRRRAGPASPETRGHGAARRRRRTRVRRAIKASSSVSGGNARRARTNERRDADATDADVGTDADAPAATPATPATPTWSTSYGGGRVSARRAARLAAMTPHREPREFREFRELREKNEGPEPRPGPAAPVPETRRRVPRTPATDDASTRLAVPRNRLRPRRTTISRRFAETKGGKRERWTRREATLKGARDSRRATKDSSRVPRTPARSRVLCNRSSARARGRGSTRRRDSRRCRPAPPLVAVAEDARAAGSADASSEVEADERRTPPRVAVVAAAARPTRRRRARGALRRSRFVPAASPADALPTLVAFRPRPPDRGPTEPGDDGPDGIGVYRRRRLGRRGAARRGSAHARRRRRPPAEAALPAEAVWVAPMPKLGCRNRGPRAASEDETRDARPGDGGGTEGEGEGKVSAVALEHSAAVREARRRDASRARTSRRDKARTLTPGKPKPGMDVFPNLVASRTTRVGGFSLPFPTAIGSHALGGAISRRVRGDGRAEAEPRRNRPFAPAAAAGGVDATARPRAARDAVDDVVDRLVLDVVTAARKTTREPSAPSAPSAARPGGAARTADEIYAQNLAKKTAEAHRLARRAEKRAAKPLERRRLRRCPTKPKPSPRRRRRPFARRRVRTPRVGGQTPRRRRLIEARRAADFASVTLARESGASFFLVTSRDDALEDDREGEESRRLPRERSRRSSSRLASSPAASPRLTGRRRRSPLGAAASVRRAPPPRVRGRFGMRARESAEPPRRRATRRRAARGEASRG